MSGPTAAGAGALPVSVRDDLALMEGYHSPQVAVDVRLNTNESPYPPPPGFVEALVDELRSLPMHRYPDRGATNLREAIAALHDVEPSQVFAANGSNEVLQLLCLAFGGPGRDAAVFEPTYALHAHIARVTGTGVVVGERAPDYSLDRDEVGRVLRDHVPAITFLCSPNNPTGTVDGPDVTAAVVEAAPGLVVVDEAYGQFAPRSALADVRDDRPVVVIRTFSKTWSLAALRLGYCVAPRSVVDALEQVTLPYHLDAAKQAAGRLALQHVPEMEARVAALVEERGRLAAAFGELPLDVWPSGANFLLFRPRDVDGDRVWHELVARSVLVRNCSGWPRLDGCLRVTVGTPAENDAFLQALREVLA